MMEHHPALPHAFGVGMILRPSTDPNRLLPWIAFVELFQIVFSGWVTFSKHYWVTSRERRSVSVQGAINSQAKAG
jgi:hypothetical protein